MQLSLGGYACYVAVAVSNSNSEEANTASFNPQLAIGTGLLIGGAVMSIGFRIYEMVRPFTYADKYNKTLFGALNSSYNTTLAILPSALDEDSLGVTALASVRF